MITVTVPLGDRTYEVLIGDGVRERLGDLVAKSIHGKPLRAAIVTEESIAELEWFGELDPGIPLEVHTIGGGEESKTIDTAHDLAGRFARSGLSRQDVVIAVGGGIVTDLTGFAASIYLRGVPYINVATSLLAQVDAAIGGKTGANLAEGKNLIGSFWQPRAVVCDTETLATLPEREWRCGRGEIAKCAFLTGKEPDSELPALPLAEQVATCAAIKARVVSLDEREGGRRALLNYGHTLAHALEAAALSRARGHQKGSGLDLRHGEAVAVGLIFAARLAHRLGRIDQPRVDLHYEVVEEFGLSTELPPGLDAQQLLTYMQRDKKSHHDLTFVLDGKRGVEVVRGVAAGDVVATLADMGATSAQARALLDQAGQRT